jgi:hypothetical protein
MKKFLAILILILTFQTPSQADDIQVFQVEGMIKEPIVILVTIQARVKSQQLIFN